MDFAYITPDHVLNVPRRGKKTVEIRLSLLSKKQCAALAAILSSERYTKSVELDSRDLTVTVYFFRAKPYLVPEFTLPANPVSLHGFAPALPESVEEK